MLFAYWRIIPSHKILRSGFHPKCFRHTAQIPEQPLRRDIACVWTQCEPFRKGGGSRGKSCRRGRVVERNRGARVRNVPRVFLVIGSAGNPETNTHCANRAVSRGINLNSVKRIARFGGADFAPRRPSYREILLL